MKVERLSHKRVCKLWEFFRDNLPNGLRAAIRDNGYGHVYGIDIKNRGFSSYFSDGIARIEDDRVELHEPQYYSDFEDIIRRYESQTGKEVTSRYWEAD